MIAGRKIRQTSHGSSTLSESLPNSFPRAQLLVHSPILHPTPLWCIPIIVRFLLVNLPSCFFGEAPACLGLLISLTAYSILLQSCYCWVAYVGWTMMNIYCCWWFQTSCLPTQEHFSRPCMGLTVRIVGQKHHGLREIPIPHVLSAKNPLISRCRILLVRAVCVRDGFFFNQDWISMNVSCLPAAIW